MRAFQWGASIALSWLWGLGLLFSWHFSVLYGPVGLLLFAVPNALGLLIFGTVTQKIAGRSDLGTWAENALRRYALVFYVYQLLAVALTLFAVAKYLFLPLGVPAPLLVAIALLFIACVAAERLSLEKVVRVHAVILAGLAIAFVAMVVNWPGNVGAGERAPLNATFFTFCVPLALGLLLGPWFDVQQWQRAVHLARARQPIAKTFAVGAGLFFALLMANGSLAIWSGAGFAAAAGSVFDPHLHAEAAFPMFAAESGSAVFKFALLVWAVGAVWTTFDSSWLAMRWFNDNTVAKSENLLVGLLPEAARTAMSPFYGLCALAAGLGLALRIDLEYFMIFYASLFLAYSAVLFREAITGEVAGRQSQAFALGIASLCLLAAGYLADYPVFLAIAPFVAILAYWLAQKGDAGSTATVEPALIDPTADAPKQASIDARTTHNAKAVAAEPSPHAMGIVDDLDDHVASHGWFDNDKWFHIHVVTTYGDTNSVGNVYFSSYFNWIGKTRELFFRACMPGFDLNATPFYILTRNFQHKFVRETREFDELLCRLKIKSYNRKFVELQHEIRDKASKLIGEGSQTLMFVDSSNYRPINIPDPVMTAFLPLAPGAGVAIAAEQRTPTPA